MAQDEQPDLIVLDLMILKMSGTDGVPRSARKTNRVPIIMLTAKGGRSIASSA